MNRRTVPDVTTEVCELYQEQEHVIGAVLERHAESSVYVAQVMVVTQLSKGLVRQLRS